MNREEALKDLKSKSYNEETLDADKEYVSKKFGIEVEELERIMNLPPKSYKDYPNDEKKLNFIYKVYKDYFSKFMKAG